MLSLVMVTIPKKNARAFSKQLLEERWIACANLISGVQSLYWWRGKIEDSSETLVLMKCQTHQVKGLEKRIKALHPYEVPEIVSYKIDQVEKAYAAWVRAESSGPKTPKLSVNRRNSHRIGSSRRVI